MEPIEIQTREESGDGETRYVFDISSYVEAGGACSGVALALSNCAERSHLNLDPIGKVVDCDAIGALLQPHRFQDPQEVVSVTFPYNIYTVTVSSDGRVVVTETDDRSAPTPEGFGVPLVGFRRL